jgi:hypothetical protein
MFTKLKEWLKKLGPGFITGAADDDPSGIATYAQTGALFGLGPTAGIRAPIRMMVGCARGVAPSEPLRRRGFAMDGDSAIDHG